MKISIITPCFNSEKTIRNTLDSVADQEVNEIEHILIDGGSTDGTLRILNEYAQRVSHAVKIVSEPDDGIYDAMNKGIRMAEGDLVGIINSDDWYERETFGKVSGIYGGTDNEIIYGAIRVYEGEGIRSIEFYHHDFLMRRMINHPGCFVSRGVYERVGLFDTTYRSSADYDWMKRAYDSGAEFVPVYDVLANIRTGGMSSSNVGFRETLKLQYQWGQVSAPRYAAYTIKSYVGDMLRKLVGKNR